MSEKRPTPEHIKELDREIKKQIKNGKTLRNRIEEGFEEELSSRAAYEHIQTDATSINILSDMAHGSKQAHPHVTIDEFSERQLPDTRTHRKPKKK
ncbi:MAG: hypothetical protein ACD_18C00113G0003 [uncultured bacterium]|nr:MAG: hypothetical protein ACD_18C00113G0003 [uncultured bacterium]OGH84556.1 MAG: hypothetical protein A2488_00165 [Candidatus Magasanikbacteria bacterium RIFOXYC12_FULL_32_21b]OGH90571.1 MAG: hypothetical protein A2507_00110 [Candidatus Magasanikbacteria bacterium RIFOXYD12_FULL_33_17]HAO52271.1 hypothetical protein [Candidatus Magasanikbacteria bacterium]